MTSDSDQVAIDLYAQGVALGRRGLWSEAEATFRQAARLAPAASLNWLSLAIARFHQERYEQAAVAILWALKAVPIRGTPESEQGIRRFEASDWAGTEQAFRQLLSRGAPETPTHLFLAVALIRLARFREAFDHLMAGYELEIAGAEAESSG